MSLRPFYLLREFGSVVVCAVYIPPSRNAARAAARIADCVHQQLLRTPGTPVFIPGDFNHCKLELSLPGFEQYVTCGTLCTDWDIFNNTDIDVAMGYIYF